MTPEAKAALPYRPCAGVVLVNADGRIFAGERIDTPGAWQMPQGGIDPGETPEVAALRELEEETGVCPDKVTVLAQTAEWLTYDLPDHLIGKVWGGDFRGQRQMWVLMRFEGDHDDITLDVAHPEFDKWDWLTAETLLAAIVDFKRPIYEQVLSEFAAHLR